MSRYCYYYYDYYYLVVIIELLVFLYWLYTVTVCQKRHYSRL